MLMKMRSSKEYIRKPSSTDTPSTKKDDPNLRSQGRAAIFGTVVSNNSKIRPVGSGTSGTVISGKSSTIPPPPPPPPPLPPRFSSKNHLRRHNSFKLRLRRPFFLRLCSPPGCSFYANEDSEIQPDSSSIITKGKGLYDKDGQEVDEVWEMINKLCIQQEETKSVVPKLQDFIQVMNRRCDLLEEALSQAIAEVEQLKTNYHMVIVEKATDDHAMNNRFHKITETEGACRAELKSQVK